MSIQFVLGGSGAGKTEFLLRMALRGAREDYRSSWILLVPEQDTLAMQRRITLHPENPGKGILNIDVMSFHRLAYRVFELLDRPLPRIIDDTGKVMLLRESSERVKEKLKLYKNQLSRPGFLSELKSQISEFYQYRIRPELLEDAAEKCSSSHMGAKLRELSLLYRAFLEYMEERGYMVEEELLDRLLSFLPETKLLDGATILFDGFTGFTPVQLDIIEEMMKSCRSLLFSLCLGRGARGALYGEHRASELFFLTGQTAEKLRLRAEKCSCPILPPIDLNRFDALTGRARNPSHPLPRFQNAPALDYLERSLYRYSAAGTEGRNFALDGSIEIWEAADQRMEIERLASEIERAVREEGLRYQDIAVLISEPEQYRDLIYRCFLAAGIPYFLDDPGSLLDSPPAKLLRAAIEVLERAFSFDSVIRCLRALPGRTPEEENEIDLFENWLRERGIRGAAAYQREWEHFDSLRRKLAGPLLRLLSEGNERGASASRRISALRGFLTELRAREYISREAERLREIGEQNRAEELLRGMDAVEELLLRFSELLGETRISRREFSELLDAGLSEASIRIIPATLDQVVIGDLTRSRFSSPKRFFLVGVSAGALPGSGKGTGILGDRERALLRSLSIELAPDQAEDALLQRFYIYRALLNPSEKLLLSYPLRGRNGKSRKPSPLIEALRGIFPSLSIRSLRHEPEEIYTREELLRSLSRTLPLYLEERERKEAREDKGESASERREAVEAPLEGRLLSGFSALLRDPSYRDRASKLLDAAFTSYQSGKLDREIAEEIYGEILYGSITRLEQYNRCAYAHFLRYGLQLSERKSNEVRALDLGNLYHLAMEELFRELSKRGQSLPELSREEACALSDACVLRASEQYNERMMQDSARNRYLLRRISEICRTTVWALSEQLRRGDFRPAFLEKDFHLTRPGFRLSGRIDRVDLCETEKSIYVKVLDYKSGRTVFDLNRIYEGLQLQLATYLKVALEELQRDYPGKEVLPAAMFYYRIDDPILDYVPGEDEDGGEDRRLRALRVDGLVNADREVISHLDREFQKESKVIPVTLREGKVEERKKAIATTRRFSALMDFVEKRMERDAAEIRGGEISVNPIRESPERSACDYCPYHSICGFDPMLEGYSYRRSGKKKMEEIWQELTEEREDSAP